MTTPPTVADTRAAAGRLAGWAVRTPLLSNAVLDERVGGTVMIKPESLQRTGSFKFRGAFNALSALSPSVRERGVVAASSGNHAQGIAEAARLLDCPATLIMPSDAPASKRTRTKRSGATVLTYDRASEDRDAIALKIVAVDDATLIHPYDNPLVVAGQGTVGLEIAEDMADRDLSPDILVTPFGGGGLFSGSSLAIRETYPTCDLVAVEPHGFDDFARSLKAGERLRNAATSGSICDALMAISPGQIGLSVSLETRARAVSVTDNEALEAMAFAFHELKLVVEPGGAVALAALLSGRIPVQGKTAAIVLSGGNVDGDLLMKALSRRPVSPTGHHPGG